MWKQRLERLHRRPHWQYYCAFMKEKIRESRTTLLKKTLTFQVLDAFFSFKFMFTFKRPIQPVSVQFRLLFSDRSWSCYCVFDCYRHICCHLIRGHSYLCDHTWFYYFFPHCVLFLYKIEINVESLFILYEKNIHISSKMFFFQSNYCAYFNVIRLYQFTFLTNIFSDTFIKCYISVEEWFQQMQFRNAIIKYITVCSPQQ